MNTHFSSSFAAKVPVLQCLCVLVLTVTGCQHKVSADIDFQRGRAALMQGNFEAADELLSNFVSNHPKSSLCSRAVFLRGKSHIGQGDLPAAQRYFEATIEQYPESEEAHKSRYKLAMICFWQGDRNAAMIGFQNVLGTSPGTLRPESEAMLRMLAQPAGDAE